MSKTLTFTVHVTFAEKIVDDNEVQEVCQNIANALYQQVENEGLAPDNSDNYTKRIVVGDGFGAHAEYAQDPNSLTLQAVV